MPPPPFDAGALHARYAELDREVWRAVGPADPAARAARLERDRARELRQRLGAYLRAFARGLGFALYVPGTHAGGIANQDLFDLLAARGWDYAAPTKRLRDHVRVTLLSEFADEPTVPLRFEVESVAAGAVLEFVAARLDRRVTDIPRPPLSAAYARAKRKRFGTGRAGSATGALADAVRTRGRITLT